MSQTQLFLRACCSCISSPKSDSVLTLLRSQSCEEISRGHKKRNSDKGSWKDNSGGNGSSSLLTLPNPPSSKRLVKVLSGCVNEGISREDELRQGDPS